jgi:hypothetical protein
VSECTCSTARIVASICTWYKNARNVPCFLIRPMPASVEGVASLFCRRATLPVQHYPRRQGRPRGCAIVTKPMERPSAHQVVKPLGQDGTALSVTFLIDVELLLRKCNVVSFRTFHAISNSQSDANLHRHRIISAASGSEYLTDLFAVPVLYRP